ncbi:LOW QUALITY PROTEIN: venom peptide isomerase heavy chain-like [Leguminivora glycinivorella]|uniref:LOW QUALITY PROTEIN: venom peptide isomerase heavy chain-like n=1 Tax=Leguminivora glycinivorella TaxID=1035111 RepID=UPI00200CC6A1|nr:LOW QUALITY PROTEIN: venom peptide isomerase heavy chain-like [Leguminivora glycinivorella]
MFLTIHVFLLILQTCGAERIIMTLKYSLNRMKTVIVNGEPVTHGTVPYVVSIKEGYQLGEGQFTAKNLCGGSIISTDKVLTAAHCFERNNFAYVKDPSRLAVVAGDLRNVINITEFISNKETQWRRISKIVIHPLFNFPLDDIAVVFVDPIWDFSEYITPIKIARLHTDYPDTCYAAGYGRTSHGPESQRSQVLLRAKITVIPRTKCKEIWEVDMDEFVCTNSVNADVAVGDSGGPLVCEAPRTRRRSRARSS